MPCGGLERLARADAFGSLGLPRRDALWAVWGLGEGPLPLFAAADERERLFVPELPEEPAALAPMMRGRQVVEDYRNIGLSLREHPMSFLRNDLSERGYRPCVDLVDTPNGEWIAVCGLVLIRQMPGSAKGVMFITLEDETANANLVVWPSLFERQRRVILSASMMGVRGRVQKEGEVIHIVAEDLIDLSDLLRTVGDRDEPFQLAHKPGNEVSGGSGPDPRFGSRPQGPRYLRSGSSHRERDQAQDEGFPLDHRARSVRKVPAGKGRSSSSSGSK
jgi:DNA polymerase III alpha subunit